jgi:hypothetical protein
MGQIIFRIRDDKIGVRNRIFHTWKVSPIRLVARRLPARVPHVPAGRSDVRVGRQRTIWGSAHLHGSGWAPLSLSVVVAGLGIRLLRPWVHPG